MANWNEICDKVGKAANKAAKKTEEIVDSTSKYVKLKALDMKLSSKYEELGRLTYKQLKNGESEAEKISEIIEELDSLRERRKALHEEIEADKKRRAEEKAARKEEAKKEETQEAEGK